MIPYADFLYFGVLLYVVVPTLILGLAGRDSRRWLLVATLAMLVVQYSGRIRVGLNMEIREVWIVAGYAVLEWAVALAFLQLRSQGRRRWTFYSSLFLALLPLIVAKYVPPIAPRIQFGSLGISYVTFRTLDVIFCIQDGLIVSLPAEQLFAYLFFFGTISSGPIDRYRRFEADWKRRRTRGEFLHDLDGAIHRVFTGFFYKFVVAALIKQYWLDPAAAQSGVSGTLSYMYAYSLHLFFDFAGYSAFAIGVSYLFGVHTPENFNRPFLASNIRDFWNRWHITLSWWLRDHVYMRFVMAATKGRWFKSRYLASYIGLFLAFGLMGLWHGTTPNYVLYGLYHGALLSGYEAFSRWNRVSKRWGDGPLWQVAGVLGTFHCVCFGFLLFSGYLTTGSAHKTLEENDTHVYSGRYEKASCEEIGGWAWDAVNPDEPVNVDIVADGKRLATVRADLLRQDLADAGRGNGAHGFLYIPPSRLKDGWPHATAVRISGTDIELSQAQQPIICTVSVEAMDGFDGVHDTADCQHITGWAWDATRPDVAVDVDVYDGKTLVGTVAADQLREELRKEGYGDGRHGFVYRPPIELNDGLLHSISVRIGGTNATLQHTPQILMCPEASTQTVAASPPSLSAPTALTNDTSPRDGGPPYRDNGDGTISDLDAGIMWEKKVAMDDTTDPANLHDADNCYPWSGSCAIDGADCRVDADCRDRGPCTADDCQASAPDGLTIFKWVARLNAADFAGHTDWRMPSSQELYRIINPMEQGDRFTNETFNGTSCGSLCGALGDPACSCTKPGVYWAAASALAAGPDDGWMMYFYCNGNLFLNLKSNKFYVRAVRGAP